MLDFHDEPTRDFSLDVATEPEDPSVQVKLTRTGVWHRKAIGGEVTACGRAMGGYAVRDDSYDGDLCSEGCFSPYEIGLNTTSKRPP